MIVPVTVSAHARTKKKTSPYGKAMPKHGRKGNWQINMLKQFIFTIPNFPSFQSRKGWKEMSTVCFWKNIFMSVHLVIISYFVAQFIGKALCRKKCRARVDDEQNCTIDDHKFGSISLGLSYQVTRFCCFILVASSLFKLIFLLLQGNQGNCSYLTSAMADASQLISWIFLLILIFRLAKTTTLKLSWIIRSWFICNFLQSAMCAALDISILLERSFLRVEQYMDIMSVFPCVVLFGLSVRGKTGISYDACRLKQPLLQTEQISESQRQSTEQKRNSPYGRASLPQLITFSWLNPLFVIGKRKPLEMNEVPDIAINDSSAFMSSLFNRCLNNVEERHGLSISSVYAAIFMLIRKKAAINASFAVVSAGASYVGPLLIDNFVKFLGGERQHGLKSGYLIATAFLCAKLVETVCQRQWVFGARQLGMRLRAALISHIYKKGLVLSNQSHQSHTSGEIINYMVVDIQRVTDVMWYSNIIWMLPVQISLAMYVLYKNLGVGALAGLAATAMVMACNVPIARAHKRFQSKIMEAKDKRMKGTAEVLRNMKILKLQAWDINYLHKIQDLRKNEYDCLWLSLRLQAVSAFIFWGAPLLIAIITFGTCIMQGIPLTTGRVLSALATFRMLQEPIMTLPDLLSVLAQGKVSADRIAEYLQEDEMKPDAVEFVPRNESEIDVVIEHGIFSWNQESAYPTLENIDLTVHRGMKVAICGTVGSGKSSLLSCILGEIPLLEGRVKISGRKAYVSQSPWIPSGNVRENIVFGNHFDMEKYEKTIEVCALKKDFELFANGDLTEIGERGINMSGGQKQRIQIARAVYQDADIYLLDDPFSALDAHTGTQLFKNCLMGALRDKTVLYITHQVEFLPEADLILVMKNGRISQVGKYDELLRQNIEFEALVGAHSEALQLVSNAETSSKSSTSIAAEKGVPEESNTNDSDAGEISDTFQIIRNQESEHDLSQDIVDKGRLTQEEEREKGSISKYVYWSYLTTVRGGALVPIIILSQTCFQVLQVASNYWMAWAAPPSNTTESPVPLEILFTVYVVLSLGCALCVLIRAMLVVKTGLLTSQHFFQKMLHSVIHAPMSFFDSTPTGRILNRASMDQSVLDLELPGKLGWCAFAVIQILGTIAVMSQVAWPVFAIFIPVTAICIWYQQYYTPTARELARLGEIQKAPILHHFSESLSGAPTIRAFEQKDRFSNTNLSLIDNHSRPWFHNISAMEWLSFRLNLLSNFVFGFSLILLVNLPAGFLNPSIAGLAVTYGINLNSQLASIIWNICNAENKIISVERIMQYTRIPSEAPLVIETFQPTVNWPQVGSICFTNLEVRYAEHLPSVLKNITCVIPGRKKVGVVGRTGSGKSTLIQALFRIVEPRQGSILIDDVDILKIGLHDLRSRLSIIPQDPTMFEGTVRGNLDPLEEYSDNIIWEVLDKCQLGNLIRQKDKKLDSTVIENGENWSVGQRQLFCLGRSLLKRSKILVLDEATASIDSATDGIIQDTICTEFSNCTILTIAHRIHTVIDSHLILVLGEGKILEYDSPSKLLEREDSSFSKLIKEYSLRSKISKIARQGAANTPFAE
ncbi:putative ABC transporter C family member 15 isoform X2 [Zingiber officinale]|uniref:putative ABC transporter C family member 15 isoform X2 n=1 Tax=Zingiber officinale TaxID=94328 RepID=UPI001C4BF22E|nr:putative ABC transporter C family member 15 isoform X2 [Zingiber officinale]